MKKSKFGNKFAVIKALMSSKKVRRVRMWNRKRKLSFEGWMRNAYARKI